MKQAKSGAIRGRKTTGSPRDSQLPWSSRLFSCPSQIRSDPVTENYRVSSRQPVAMEGDWLFSWEKVGGKIMFKKLSVIAIVLFLLGGSVIAFAWWDSLTADEDVTIGVGEGVTISVNLDEQTDGVLVPAGVVMKEGDVTEVDVEFTVNLDDTEDIIAPLDFIVTITNVEIGGEAIHAGLVNTSISASETIQNDPVEVTITVTLDMPESEVAYNAVATEDITFDVTFEASIQE